MRIVVGQNDLLGAWMCAQQEADWQGIGQCIGLLDGDTIIAVCCFDQYNEANINMHVAGTAGRYWLTKEFLWYCFHYPFIELGVKRVTGLVASSNLKARKLDEHLGFTLEATLKDAHPDGDMLVYKMTRDQCRWLNLKDPRHGQTQSTPST